MDIEPKRAIFSAVRECPGVHFRELQRLLGMPVGQLEYHLRALDEEGLIKSTDDRYYKRYFASEVDARDKPLLGALRQENPRRIVLHLMLNPGTGHGDLSIACNLALSSLSFYLNDLVSKGIIIRLKDGRAAHFSVAEPERVSRALITYRRSFLDKLVDRFISIWFARAPFGAVGKEGKGGSV
jgi:predicted transcriptional regulator